MKKFQVDCCNYFVEVVSTLCFGGDKVPEPDLIKMLMEIIYKAEGDTDTELTQDLTFLTEEKEDKLLPIIRSSLLQLLFEHK